MRFEGWIAAAIFIAIGVVGTAAPAQGQYFGRNKVRYEDFDFQVLKTAHFDIYFYPGERAAVERAARMAERWYVRLSRLLNHQFDRRQPLILYASHPHFRQTNVLQGTVGPGTGGATEPLRRRIVLPFAGPLAETDHVIGHELVHAFQFDMLRRGASGMPLWFIEGMAEYLSRGPVDALTAMWLRDALENDNLPSLAQLQSPEFFPYRYGHAFFAFIGGTWGDEAIGEILRRAGGMRGASAAVLEYTELSEKELTEAWHETIAAAYEPLRSGTRPPEEHGRLLIGEENAGTVNLAPALSPDGQRIAFLSEKSQFAIEIFVADAETGEVTRKVTETALDPHYESLQFISSAGAWSPEGRRLAFVAVSGGQPLLTLLDTESGEKVRERKFPELGEIANPSWSPDGRFIAFSGIDGGYSDLFMWDLETDSLIRLTEDPYADLQPAWSPDGRRMAFVTDRYTTDLEGLDYGAYRIGLFDPETGSMSPAPSLDTGKAIDPHWSPDGGSIYFLSDADGITDVYRVELESGRYYRLTHLYTGVTGITGLSPALSVAARSGELAFSAYTAGDYAIYAVDEPGGLERQISDRALAGREPAALPPQDRESSQVASLLRAPATGLPPADTTFAVSDYSAGLGLAYVAPPTVVAGADQFGAFVAGGSTLFFSDMLNHHLLATSLQVSGSFENLTAAVAYQNQEDRLIWGLTAERVPLLFGDLSIETTSVGGEEVLVQRSFLFRQVTYRVVGTAWYPINRSHRLEFSGGYRRIGFDIELDSAVVTAAGEVVSGGSRESSPFDALNLGTASAALVYDNSIFGATSPILGQRYRFEATPIFGSINIVEALGDYRKYFMPVRPFTLAFRVLHFGRYGGDADDDRLNDLYVGFPGLVRGYERGSFSVDECEPTPTDPCPVFNQLFGTRIAVANAEVRFPLFGVLGLGEGYYGAVPLEMAFFGDAGLAWQSDLAGTPSDESAFFLGGDRDPVFSAGAAWRLNLFRYLVLQFDVARAFERDKWVTQLTLLPGF
ncbi:MAG: BamA/TamA family outer membrane protein [Gemmatimonadetes bacterium]|uniref:BamA/TamA family outer membrane protein n=1 Tax=Candidatus Kutchimonas denitrificans TaxID=3056748 RepID=A0AAE4ZAZ9_9BACT|nr:BamA/TamA family outer membrane protein [Gemmatimonadota bacterium]NIR75912.1 BamA/TamA family outer membrane protein [Candidatus Kutchimonas denitrificans]NIS02073.1 BamA/TamA family outer membrane protein [Gemmatimonadota bacterium]NIT67879.1 BamA/TamA family outer membrane protein [Gemmatimonadota bacterium]NIU53858.1 BamA/TamA family outer membrane protein [Gemmatimonadota bacterium]